MPSMTCWMQIAAAACARRMGTNLAVSMAPKGEDVQMVVKQVLLSPDQMTQNSGQQICRMLRKTVIAEDVRTWCAPCLAVICEG